MRLMSGTYGNGRAPTGKNAVITGDLSWRISNDLGTEMVLMQDKDDIRPNVPWKTAGNDHDMKISVIEPKAGDEKKLWPDLERLQVAVKPLAAGGWTVDISANALTVCNRCKEIIPACDAESVKVDRLRGLIANGYDEKVVEIFLLALRTGSAFDMEVPMIVANGLPEKWLRITGATAFNSNNTMQKLHGIVEDISERKNSELLKQDFLAMVSHDLRSPLSVIKLYMQMCGRLAGNIGNNDIPEMLEKAEIQVDKMNRMIQCYLESSAMYAGKISHFPLLFDIKELLQEVIGDLRLLYPGHTLFLKSGQGVQVSADREKIAQVLQNLLSNAIKYSSRIDAITVDFKKTGNCLQVSVEDHGPGIKPAEQEKIFERFYRVEGENGAAVKGYGIGLYLCKKIIKQHNGDIWLTSEVNKGSKFYFTLPLS